MIYSSKTHIQQVGNKRIQSTLPHVDRATIQQQDSDRTKGAPCKCQLWQIKNGLKKNRNHGSI